MELQSLKNVLYYVKGIRELNKERKEELILELNNDEVPASKEYMTIEIEKSSALVRAMDGLINQITHEINEIYEYEHLMLEMERESNRDFLSTLGGAF